VALAQLNPTVGDLDGNIALVADAYSRAVAHGCHVLLAPELAVTGYPPEDLVHKPRFVARNREALERFAATTGSCAAVVGFVLDEGGRLFNAVAVCVDGRVASVYRKQHLPNYAVFDEERYFEPGPAETAGEAAGIWVVAGTMVGISICEDIWHDDGPAARQVAGGARVVLNVNGSPFHDGKHAEREEMLARRARSAGVPVVYVNQVGGQDELVFDGTSTVVDASGEVRCRLASFEPDFGVVDIAPDGTVSSSRMEEPGDDDDRVLAALVTGTRDYVRKNGFTDVVIGLSGGIDSSIVAAVAVQALGADRVHGVAMPSRYSSEGSLVDAAALAANLGIDHRVVPIEPAFSALLGMLEPSFAGRQHDITEENLQSRVRGTTLMAMSNKFGWLVLTTGNKSELAVGYFTIYGDSAGAFSVIKDVYKTRVFALCRRINERAGREIVPESVIVKPPSAELRHDQRDDQSLPPYDVLDAVLRAYVDEDVSVAGIVASGHDASVVERVARLVDSAEHKRRQTAPGVRISEKAFGKDRRMPITNGYREPRA
jgi:NAD+ synthase (glutamine-hydrolysing)